MGVLKNTVEPLAIVSAFTLTTLVNRTRSHTGRQYRWWEPQQLISDSETASLIPHPSRSPTREHKPGIEECIPHPDNSRFHNNLVSRFLRKFPFLIEIWYWALAYWPYQLMRARTAVWINSSQERHDAVFRLAKQNAIRILKAEQWLGIAVEQRWQQFLLTQCKPWVMTLLCDIYLAHITVGVTFLGYGYTYFPRRRYQRIRRTITINNFLAFIVLTAYRCTPPRLMAESYGFEDVLHPRPGTGVGEPSDWANNRFQLTIAAMPSLHFGTSMLIGVSVCCLGKQAWLRCIAPLYPIVMGLTVVGTANHWILDCVAGVFVVLTGWYVNWILLGLRLVEEWGFWLVKAEKPKTSKLRVRKPDLGD